MKGDHSGTEPAVTLKVFPQDPDVLWDPVDVTVRGNLLPGPVGPRVAVYDFNRDRDEVYPPATMVNGSFPDYDRDDFRFHQLNAYAITANAVEVAERELGRDLIWPFEASRLIVLPHAGERANAFYDQDTHSLQFYSFLRANGARPYHTCLSHDVVAHEAGHAILDAVRSRLIESFERESWALHEAVGDLTGMFAALEYPVVRDTILPVIDQPNLVTEIADAFDGERRPIRSLIGVPRDDWELVTTAHELSQKLTTCLYAALVDMVDLAGRHLNDPAEALGLARRALQRMFVRGLDFLPPADADFEHMARGMLAADTLAHASDAMGFRDALVREFVRYGVLAGPPADLVLDDSTWHGRPSTWPGVTPRDAYLFLDRHRKRLALHPQAEYRDFVVRDLLSVSRPAVREMSSVDQVILVYEYPVDVELSGAAFRQARGEWITLHGGGTLVFDAGGTLRYHCEMPVTRERVARVRGFLRDELGAGRLAVFQGSGDDELRVQAARQPHILLRGRGGMRMRSNAGARCPASRSGARRAGNGEGGH